MTKYYIHCAYEDEIYNQDKDLCDFNIQNGAIDYFTDRDQVEKLFDKIVDANENSIQNNGLNTFYLIELIKVNGLARKVLKSKRYM